MLIKCQACGHENQLGNIFCRNCGEKLDIDASRPEVKDMKSGNNILGIVKRVVYLLVFLLVVYVIFAAFVPAGPADMPTLAEEQKKAVDKRLESLSKRLQGRLSEGDKFSFTADEASYALNTLVKIDCPVIVKINYKSVVFASTLMLFNTVPIRYTVAGYPVNPEESTPDRPVSLAVCSAELGRLDLLPFFGLGDLVVDKFRPVWTNEKIKGLLSEMARIEVDDKGELVLAFKEKKKDKK